MGPVTSGGSSKVQVGRVVRGQGSGTYADWGEQRPWCEGGGGRGRARYMAQSSMRGRSRQRAKIRKGACERDCRAEGEGQLGREGQGTESCGMPDAAAASAGWSHGQTHCTRPGVESTSGRWEHGGIRNGMGGHLSHSGLQRGPGRPLVAVREGGSAVKSHSKLQLRGGRGRGVDCGG